MDTAIIVAIIAAISSSGVSSLILYLLQRRDKKRDKADDVDKLTKQLLLGLTDDCIERRSSQYKDRGWLAYKERTALENLYAPYKALGGEGSADLQMEDVRKLELRTDDQVRREASPT